MTGRVQGVGYRAAASREADAAGLTGFARNRAGYNPLSAYLRIVTHTTQ